MALSFLVGYFIFREIFKTEQINLKLVDKGAVYVAIGTIIGARLGHILFYYPNFYWSNPKELFNILEGGLASHGAAIGIFLAMWFFSKQAKLPFLWLMDRLVIVVALSGFFIRTGNFINSGILGKPADIPWAVIFERTSNAIPRHPVQIYEAIAYLGIFFLLALLYRKLEGKFDGGFLLSIFLITCFSIRFILEFFKAKQAPIEEGMVLNMGNYLSIPFIVVGFILFFLLKLQKQFNPKYKFF